MVANSPETEAMKAECRLQEKAASVQIAPSWLGLLPLLLEVASKAEASDARKFAYEELQRMAKAADLAMSLRDRLFPLHEIKPDVAKAQLADSLRLSEAIHNAKTTQAVILRLFEDLAVAGKELDEADTMTLVNTLQLSSKTLGELVTVASQFQRAKGN